MDVSKLQYGFKSILAERGRGEVIWNPENFEFIDEPWINQTLGGHYTFINSLLNYLRTLYKGHARKALPEIYFDYVEEYRMGAFAGLQAGTAYIGMNVGTVLIIYDICHRILCSPTLLPHIGDPSKEVILTGSFQNLHLSGGQWTSAIAESPFDYPYKRPVDPVRAEYAWTLAANAVNTMAVHECAHILYGHTELKAEHPSLSDSVIQGMEVSADAWAASHSLKQFCQTTDLSSVTSDQLRNFMLSNYLMQRVTGSSHQPVSSLFVGKHPSAPLRFFWTSAIVAQKLLEVEQGKDILDAVDPVDVTVNAEKAFLAVTEQEADWKAYADLWDRICGNEGTASLHQFEEEYEKLRPELERYTYITLPPQPARFG